MPWRGGIRTFLVPFSLFLVLFMMLRLRRLAFNLFFHNLNFFFQNYRLAELWVWLTKVYLELIACEIVYTKKASLSPPLISLFIIKDSITVQHEYFLTLYNLHWTYVWKRTRVPNVDPTFWEAKISSTKFFLGRKIFQNFKSLRNIMKLVGTLCRYSTKM